MALCLPKLRCMRDWLISFLCLICATSTLAAPRSDLWAFWQGANEEARETIDHQLWQEILDAYVHQTEDGVNLFAYGVVSNTDAEKLDRYLLAMQVLDPRDYPSEEQRAYWINLYNALTVDLILENYPVKSITKLGKGFFRFGPWDDSVATVADKELTLNDIEHRILRPIWPDPRIHFAVNCASIGCPNLQKTAFTADNLEDLMSMAAKDYLSHARGVDFQDGGKLRLSSIFDWYADDFGANEAEVLMALSRFASSDIGAKLQAYNGKISYGYDWGLNEHLGEVD